jgi:hypothetical protein
LALSLALAACGGKTGTFNLDIHVSPVDDPFASATTVRFTIGNSSHVKSYPVSNGMFKASFDQSPVSSPGPITVEALDGSGNLVAHGTTVPISLQAAGQNLTYGVWVGRPGRIAPADSALTAPLAEFASVNVPGLGIFYIGGRGTDGHTLKDVSLYAVQTQTLYGPVVPNSGSPGIAATTTGRAGAIGAVSGGWGMVVDGASSDGFASTGAPASDAEQYQPESGDPTTNQYGKWSTIAGTGLVGRSFPQAAVLSNGDTLVTGGFDDGGARLASAFILTNNATPVLSSAPIPMVAPRAGHVTASARFSDGDGALVVGGLDAGSTAPVAERAVGQLFSAIDLPGVENRLDATATTLPTGTILIVGGSTSGVAQKSGWAIDPNANPVSVMAIDGALSTARAGHTATLLDDGNLLVCGGADDQGQLVPSCDLVDGVTFALKTTLPLANARRGASALKMDTGIVMIAGGFGKDGAPLATMEIYTP